MTRSPPPLPQLVLGRAGFNGRRDLPWGTPPPDDVDPGMNSGARLIPQANQETIDDGGGWLGYAFVLVAPDGSNPPVVRVKSRLFTTNLSGTVLSFAFEKTLDLQER